MLEKELLKLLHEPLDVVTLQRGMHSHWHRIDRPHYIKLRYYLKQKRMIRNIGVRLNQMPCDTLLDFMPLTAIWANQGSQGVISLSAPFRFEDWWDYRNWAQREIGIYGTIMDCSEYLFVPSAPTIPSWVQEDAEPLVIWSRDMRTQKPF